MAKKIPITKVKIGEVLAEDILSSANVMLAPKGTVITGSVLDLFSNNSVFIVSIEEENMAVEAKTESYFSTVRASKKFKSFREKYEYTVNEFKKTMNAIVTENAPINVEGMIQQTIDIYSPDIQKTDLMDYMMNMRDYDDSTFCHSMNVALIARVFCDWLHWSEEDKNLATICGLLHDIGKMQIPESIVKKPGKLTDEEFEIIKTHPVLGYRILERQNIDDRIKKVALMHHLKCDGTGYPTGFQTAQLDRFTKLITIVDIYDAMTANRVYRGPMSPFAVVSAFEEGGLRKYDPKMIMCFLQNVANSFLNNTVTLSNGAEGKVIFINKGDLAHPTVLCGDEFVDLSNNTNISIEKMG